MEVGPHFRKLGTLGRSWPLPMDVPSDFCTVLSQAQALRPFWSSDSQLGPFFSSSRLSLGCAMSAGRCAQELQAHL